MTSATSTTGAGTGATNPTNGAATQASGAARGGQGLAPNAASKVRGAAFSQLLGARKGDLASSALTKLPAMKALPGAAGPHGDVVSASAHGHGKHVPHGDPADDSSTREGRDTREKTLDALCDPMARHSAQIAPPSFAPLAAAPAETHAAARARASLEELLPSLVKRIAWSGDRTRGTVRMELGAGALEGGTLTIHSDAGRVRVELQVPPGADAASWRARIAARLGERGIDVEAIDVG